jgi:hypothetical protein
MYEPNLEDLSDLNEKDMQKDGINTTSQISLKMRLIKKIIILL